MNNIYASLWIFREKVSAVKKDADNPFYKSKYADLNSVLEVIKEPLKESGLSLSHRCFNVEWSYSVVTTLCHSETGEIIESEFPVFWSKPQEIGSSISYARRYNLMALLDIPTEDDDGNTANDKKQVKKETVDTPTGGTKPKALSSKDETCPSCWIVNMITVKWTTKEGREYEKCDCPECWSMYFINRK